MPKYPGNAGAAVKEEHNRSVMDGMSKSAGSKVPVSGGSAGTADHTKGGNSGNSLNWKGHKPGTHHKG